ncbi:MAG: hypothetical protein QOF71_3672 [Candidatus Eremiobacteraeota bacterium]|nr:hypothetical protein [Candidatus Eremiobacteraeota bacterium]
MKSTFHAAAIALAVAAGAQYTIIDEQGHVVGSLVTETPPGAQLRVIGVANAKRNAPLAQSDARADRTFHPNYAGALTIDQMARAWQAEADRLAPPIVTGGG